MPKVQHDTELLEMKQKLLEQVSKSRELDQQMQRQLDEFQKSQEQWDRQ